MFQLHPTESIPQNSRVSALVTASAFLLLSIVGMPSLAKADTPASIASRTQIAIDSGTPPAWWSAEPTAEIRKNVDNKGNQLAEKLKLEDVPKTKKAAALISKHYTRVWTWHQTIDEQLDAAWNQWDQARSNANGKEKDELKALSIMSEMIDPIYAEFAPQIQGFLYDLKTEIGEEKTTELLDIITRSPGAPRTYKAYLAMVPQMTADEKAIIWNRLAQAREDSLAAWSDKRIVKIFKKYKVRNEFSIDYFGYGYKESYNAWIEASKKSN